MAEIFLFPISEAEKLSNAYCKEHFPKRTERADRLLRREEYLRCIGAGALLWGVLGIREEEICLSEHQKPFVRNTPIHFNLSHSGKYALLATDSNELGADIEQIRPEHLGIAEKYYLPEEQEWMRADPQTRFYQIWTLKESVMKQCGLGFGLSPNSFSVLPLLGGDGITIEGRTLYAVTTTFEDHCISVCTSHPQKTITPKILTVEDLK